MKHFPVRCVCRILGEEIALMRGRFFVHVDDIVAGFAFAGKFPSEPVVLQNRTVRAKRFHVIDVDQAANLGSVFR
jgi:hypothetical protein